MCELSNRACFTASGARTQVRAKVNWLSGLLALALLLGLCPARADDADDQYLQIYGLIQQADDFSANGKRAPARAKYLEAYKGLKSFKKSYPDWNAKLVASRLKYVTQQITVLSEQSAAAVASSATNAPTATTAPKPSTPTSSGPLKLLSAGAEPRKALRLHPTAGDKQALLLKMEVTLLISNLNLGGETKAGDAQPAAGKLPSVSATIDVPAEVTITKISEKGDITCEVVLGDANLIHGEFVGGAPSEAKQKQAPLSGPLSGVKGMSATITVSRHGFSKGCTFRPPTDSQTATAMAAIMRTLMDMLEEAFNQLTPPLPEEAVGAGAKWEVKAPAQVLGGHKVPQTANYELVSLEGEQLKIKVISAVKAAYQEIDKSTATITNKLAGELNLDAGKLLPSSGTMELHSEMNGSSLGGAQTQMFTMKRDVNLRIEAK
jgi:hypothetical protein